MAYTGDERISYSDIVTPDDSIKQLIQQLGALNTAYEKLTDAVKQNAADIIRAMKSTSSATSEGREQLDDAAIAANRLERAEKELKFALSETGHQVAWLKSQTAAQNKMSVEQEQRAKALAGSYNKLCAQVKDLTSRWKELSAEERNGEKGDRLLSQLISKKQALSELDKQMKIHVTQLTEVQKAEQRLAFLQSEEGQRLIELKRQISETISGRKKEKHSVGELEMAYQKLDKARSATNIALHELNMQTAQANKIAKLTAQINNSAEGSYDRLAAQYELNKIKLNAMSKEERQATQIGKALELETKAIYDEMTRLQEATGNHKLSVGNYAKAWSGLEMATAQVVRELPAVTMGFNTFMLAISNNIPILIDEINRVTEANKRAKVMGKSTVPVMKQIIGTIFSWQTALIILITYLSMHGKEVLAWAEKLIKGADATMTLTEQLGALQEEIKTTNASFGTHVTKVRELQRAWNDLTSDKAKLQFIKDMKTEFDQLGVSIRNISEAENLLIDNTDLFLISLKYRAKAAAAMNLASKKYEEALTKQQEASSMGATYTLKRSKDKNGKINYEEELSDINEEVEATWWQKFRAGLKTALKSPSFAFGTPGITQNKLVTSSDVRKEDAKDLDRERKAAEKDADAFEKLAKEYMDTADSLLKLAGIEKKHKTDKGGRGRQPRDLTDIINRNEIELRKKYEQSITALMHDEYAQRRKEAMDSTMTEIAQLKEKYRKNETYVANVDGKYKKLTEDQKKQIEQQQQWILDTVKNAQEKLSFELKQIEIERQVNSLKIYRETIDWQLDDMEHSINREKDLRVKALNDEEELVKKTNAVLEEGGRSEEEITAEYNAKRRMLIAEFDQQILALKEADIEAGLELVKKGSDEELALLIRQNEIARQMALAENRAKPAGEQQSEANINKVYDQRAQIVAGNFAMSGFDEAQKQAEATFNIVRRSEYAITKFKLEQERDRWEKQIELAEAGALKWSQAQIDEAKATVLRINRELEEKTSFLSLVGEKGLGGAILTKMGFDDKAIQAANDVTDTILDNINSIMEAEVEAAEVAVEAANKRVEAAQNAYDAEIEARNNGYANNVATAKKELQQEKRNQQEKQKLLEAAQRRQEAVQSVVQTSSLITASAELWASFSSVPIVGPSLALAAIATMWTSFAVAKVKAAQATKAASQEYGDGGLEFLEGGSHASGDDIDLQTKNSRGRNMRAEGGEALAIINRRSTKRYRKQLPDIINSLNKGTFEEKYLKAFERGESLQAQIFANSASINLSKVEAGIEAIRKQNESKMYSAGNVLVEVKGNVTRYYKF